MKPTLTLLSPGTGHNAHHPSVSATIYSDDHGCTWQAGDIAISLEWLTDGQDSLF